MTNCLRRDKLPSQTNLVVRNAGYLMVRSAITKRRLVATLTAGRLVFETSSRSSRPFAHDLPETGRLLPGQSPRVCFSAPCPTHGFEDGGHARISPVAP